MEQEAQILYESSADAANDIRLVGEVLRKDRKATAEFVERYADCVYSYVRRRVMPQAETVEDLVQEVFLAAWNSLRSFRGEASLRHWLLGIARHKIEDYYRKRLREPEGQMKSTRSFRSRFLFRDMKTSLTAPQTSKRHTAFLRNFPRT